MIEEFEKRIEYTNQLIAMVDEELDCDGKSTVYRDIMIAARLGLLNGKHELERDLFIRKMSSKSKEEERINDNWNTIEKQRKKLMEMMGQEEA